jgi:nucleoside-diphosphate kinase
MSNITFTMIKPDAVADGHIGAILGKIAEGGFKIKALKLTQLTVADAKKIL